MNEYIERERLKEAFNADLQSCKRWTKNLILIEIDEAPAADVAEVRHGRWVRDDSGVIYCSECGEEHEWDEYRATYCDACGALMDGEDEYEAD